jgi:hypothetical protein
MQVIQQVGKINQIVYQMLIGKEVQQYSYISPGKMT